jgi:hypothetical protein
MNQVDGQQCHNCKKPISSADNYCSTCGILLESQTHAIHRYLDSVLPGRIDSALRDRFKDQKVVELETAELVANRAISWLKIVGFFVGIPLALLMSIISFFGLKTYSDLEALRSHLAKPEQQLTDIQGQISVLETGVGSAQHNISVLQYQQKVTTVQIHNILTASQRDKIKSFIERFATGSYDRVLSTKGVDVQFGLDEWSMRYSDDFNELLASYCRTSSAVHGGQLAPYLHRTTVGDASLSADSRFLKLLQEVGTDPVMQKMEDAALDADLDSNMALATKLGVQQPLSIAIIVHAASWLGGDVVEGDAVSLEHLVAKSDEVSWIKKFLIVLRQKHGASSDFKQVLDFYDARIRKDDWQLSGEESAD